MKKRILHVLSSNDFAGAENIAIGIISYLSDIYESGYASPAGLIQEVLRNRGIEHVEMKKLSIRQLQKIIREWKPDLIHAHDFTATIKCSLATLTIPVISHIHQNPHWLRSINKYSVVFYLTCLKIQKIVVVSPIIKETSFLARFTTKCIPINNIVDKDFIKKNALLTEDKDFDLAFVGRYEDIKNPLRFIDICEKVIEIVPTLRVVMLGGGSLEELCRQTVLERNLQKNIEIRGFQMNPYPSLQSSKIFVMTSKSEGLPMVLMEALALSKPVIVPRLPGINNIVDNSCSYICETDDEFVEAIVVLLHSKEEYQRLTTGAYERAEKLSDIVQYKYHLRKVYNSVL